MWVYLNGEIIPAIEAKISPLDRSFTFGDGVYEVIPSYNQELFLFEEHLQRFKISLAKTFIPAPTELNKLKDILKKLHVKNEFQNQSFYIQITRGVQESRSHTASENIELIIKPIFPICSANILLKASSVEVFVSSKEFLKSSSISFAIDSACSGFSILTI